MVFKRVLRNISFKKKKDLVKERGHKIAEICNEDGDARTRECSTKRGSIISRLSFRKKNKKKLAKLSKDGDAPNVTTNYITSDAECKREVFMNQYDNLIVKNKESSVEDSISEKTSSVGTLNTESVSTVPESIFKSSNLDIVAKPPSIRVGPNADDTLSAAKLESLAGSKSIKDTGVGITQEETRDGNLDITAKPPSSTLDPNADDKLSAAKVASLAASKSIKDTGVGITQEETRDGKSQVIIEKNHKITCWKDALIDTLIDTYTCGDDLSDIGEDSVGNKTGFEDSIENVRESVGNTSKVLDTNNKLAEKSFKKTPENAVNLEIKQRNDEVKDSEKQNSGYKESSEKDICSGIESILKIPDGVNSALNKKNNEGAPKNAVNLEIEQRSDEVKDSVKTSSGDKESLEKDICSGIEGVLKIPNGDDLVSNKKNNVRAILEVERNEVKDSVKTNSGDKESLEKDICSGIEGVLKIPNGDDLASNKKNNVRAILEVERNNNGKDEKGTPQSDLPKYSKKVGNVLILPDAPPIRKGRSCDGVTIISTATLLVNELMTKLAEEGFADYNSAVNTINELATYIAEECNTYGNVIDKEVSAQLNNLLDGLNDIKARIF